MKSETVYRMIPSYTMKVRIYPSKEQAKKIDSYFYGLEKAANITLYALKNHEPMITREEKNEEDEKHPVYWPDWYKMLNKNWLDRLRAESAAVKALPGSALSSNVGGLFWCDMKKAWEKQGKLPVDVWFARLNKKGRPILKYYGGSKKKTSYFTQISSKNFRRTGKGKVVVKVPILGEMKIRGWNDKIRYGSDAQLDFWDNYRDKSTQLSCRISRNNIGEYELTIATKNACRPVKVNEHREAVGIDVNVKQKTGVALSNGKCFPNPRFKKQKANEINFLETCLSRRYGMSNEGYRKERSKVKQRNKTLPYEERIPYPEPSNGYKKADMKLKKISMKVARQRDLYQHEVAAAVVSQANYIAMEDLDVKGMMKDRNYSEGLGDTALSAQLLKIKYKAEWSGIEVKKIGRTEPSSHICPDCGYRIPVEEWFGTNTRKWTCPACGTFHERDHAAARTILKLATGELEPTDIEPDNKEVPDDVPFGKKLPELTTHFVVEMVEEYKNPWVVTHEDGTVLDDAQGYGYDTAQKAQRAYRYKLKHKK